MVLEITSNISNIDIQSLVRSRSSKSLKNKRVIQRRTRPKISHIHKCRKNPDQRLSTTDDIINKELASYKNREEIGIPEPVKKFIGFIKDNNILAWIFRKDVTTGCESAFWAKQKDIAVILPVIKLEIEIKTIVLTGRKNSVEHLYAFHLPADRKLPSNSNGGINYNFLSDLLSQHNEKVTRLYYTKSGMVPGRINPITLAIDHPDCTHIFDLKYYDTHPSELIQYGTTNAGMNTFACIIKVQDVITCFKKLGINLIIDNL